MPIIGLVAVPGLGPNTCAVLDASEPVDIAFWNTQHISGNVETERAAHKLEVAERLAEKHDAVVLAEVCGNGEIEGFTTVRPVVGAKSGHKLKSAYHAGKWIWTEHDIMPYAHHPEVRNLLNKCASDLQNVKLRRPLCALVQWNDSLVLLAAIHAPSGAHNPLNHDVLLVVIAWLQDMSPDSWVLFGDLNMDPTTVQSGAHTRANTYLGALQKHMGELGCEFNHCEPYLPTHAKGTTLDFALFPPTMKGRVECKRIDSPWFHGGSPYPSDHFAIRVRVKPP